MPKKTTNDTLDALITRLSTSPLFAKRAPHPRAAKLTLPDERLAPAGLRAWAAFDGRYPSYLSTRRSDQPIADKAGVVHAKPMKAVLRSICIDDIDDDEVDDETKDHLKELVSELVEEYPGLGVRIAPDEQPDRILWFGDDEGDEATVLCYENDSIEVVNSFDEWVVALFEDD